MLTPEVIELCKKAATEEFPDKMLELVREINRLLELRPAPVHHQMVLKRE